MRLFRQRIADREIATELEQHLNELIAANLRDGMTPDEARRQALVDFGPVSTLTEECRDARSFEGLASLLRDLRFGVRHQRRAPGFSVTVILSLCLGIGASSTLFSLVNAAILRMIPVHDPAQLVWFDSGSHGRALSYPFYQEVRRHPSFDGVLAAFATPVNLSSAGMADRVAAELVSGNYFAVLGLQPHRGRLLNEADDRQPVAVVSHQFWQTRLAGSEKVIGQSIQVNGASWTVVGVAPVGYGGLDRAYQRALFVPLGMKPQITPGWNGLDKPLIAWFSIAGRLKPAVDRLPLGHELNVRFQAFQEAHLPLDHRLSPAQWRLIRGRRLRLDPLGNAVFAPHVAEHLAALSWMVGLLLALACVNVAGLMLARGIERRKELATRLSIGASRARVMRQLLAEAFLLASAGGLGGLLGTAVAAPLLASRFPLAGINSQLEVPLDWRVLCFTLAVSLATCLTFGLLPAWQATKLDLVSALKGAPWRVSTNRLRLLLISVQASVSLVLLCVAGLFVSNLHELLFQDSGYDRRRLLLAELEPALSGYDEAARIKLYAALERRLGEQRDAAWVAVALSNVAPMSPYSWSSLFIVRGREKREDHFVRSIAVGEHYFDTLRIPLRQGRLPSDRERTAVISESLARREFPHEDPLGQRFIGDLRDPAGTTFEIVGVVADANLQDPRNQLHLECVYFSYRQWAFAPQSVVVQARLAPGVPAAAGAARLRQALHDVDPALAFYAVRTIEQASESLLATERLTAWLTSFFGVSAALLFAVGLHGLVSRDLAARAKEVAIRLVLGAHPSSIVGSLARGPLLAAAAGLAAGVGLLTAVAPKLTALPTKGLPADTRFLLASAAFLLASCAAALVLPVWRARTMQPTTVLQLD